LIDAGRGAAPRLYLITDRQATAGRPLVEVGAAALPGAAASGLPAHRVAVQLREKDLPARPLLDLARALRALTARAGVALYVNERVDVALAAEADGVHLGGGALPFAEVARLAPKLALATSVHSAAELETARHAAGPGLAFAVCGPVRDTPSKRPYGPPIGFDGLSKAAELGVPLLALGGIEPSDVAAALRAGAAGIACIRAILSTPDPAAAAAALCQALI
jgi:thiamine-phosphate pyrophosphorylase